MMMFSILLFLIFINSTNLTPTNSLENNLHEKNERAMLMVHNYYLPSILGPPPGSQRLEDSEVESLKSKRSLFLFQEILFFKFNF